MSNWKYSKVQGDEINVKNYIIDIYFELNTTFCNYTSFDKSNEGRKKVVMSGIIALWNLLKNYKTVRDFKNAESRAKFEELIQAIKDNCSINYKELDFCIDILGQFMFMVGFTDINREYKDFEKTL
jgi:hypothetical protein